MDTAIARDMCRVSVDSGGQRVDLCVPARVPVRLLIPAIVDAFSAGAEGDRQRRYPSQPADYLLCRIIEGPLSGRKGLADQGVRDGELLVLTRPDPVLRAPVDDDAAAAVSTALSACASWGPRAARIAGPVALLWCSLIGAIALLLSTGLKLETTSAATACVLAIASLAGAIAARRFHQDEVAPVVFSVCAVAFGAVAGYLVVPGVLIAPKLLLAASVAMTVSMVAVYILPSGTTVLTALTAFTILTTAVAAASVLVPLTLAAAGSLLAALSVGLLAASGRLAISIARLPVPPPVGDMPAAEGSGTVTDGARRADAVLTGLVCGFSVGAAVGSHLAVVGEGLRGSLLAVIVGLSLLLRSRTHVSASQVTALIVGGTITLSAAFLCAALSWPTYGPGFGVLAALAGAAGFALGRSPSPPASPLTRRCVDAIEYCTLAALAPAAFWVCGLYATARGLHLP